MINYQLKQIVVRVPAKFKARTLKRFVDRVPAEGIVNRVLANFKKPPLKRIVDRV